MKKLVFAASIFMFPLSGFAAGGYVEGQVGHTSINNINYEEVPVFTESVSGNIDFKGALNYGVEIGLRNFEKYNVLRLSIGWKKFDAEVDSIAYSVNGAPSETLTRRDLIESGMEEGDLSDKVEVFSANIYYDFPTEWTFKPYIGVGLGLVDIESADEKEQGLLLSIGGRYAITENLSWGIKYQHEKYNKIDGESEFRTNMISATLAFNF